MTRPKHLENVCLADFVACYSKSQKQKISKSQKENVSSNEDDEYIDEENDHEFDSNDHDICGDEILQSGEEISCTKSGPIYVMRKRPRVICYVKFQREKSERNYCREHLMLFYPWRDEQKDLIDVNSVELCQQYFETIVNNKAKYVYNTNIDEEIDFAVAEVQRENYEHAKRIPKDTAILDENYDCVAPEYEVLNDRLDEGDIDMDLGYRISTSLSNSVTKFKIPNMLSDDEYYSLMKSLNDKQRRYFLQVLYLSLIHI